MKKKLPVLKEQHSVQVMVVDREIRYPITVIVTGDNKEEIKASVAAYLKKWRVAMDLSHDYKFHVIQTTLTGHTPEIKH